ncbi:hypothetical protein SDC9_150356 [bioreactor metagenome]|uniref:Uncharacterized protein n=1 Tax=bioreactor metagenome TaxID=1076179 RepID=A0A645ERH5_9ZZZZ
MPAVAAPNITTIGKGKLSLTDKIADVYAPIDIKPAFPKEKRRVNPVNTDIPNTAIILIHTSVITPC